MGTLDEAVTVEVALDRIVSSARVIARLVGLEPRLGRDPEQAPQAVQRVGPEHQVLVLDA